MFREVIADLGHEFDRTRVNPARWPRTGAERFDPVAAVQVGERLGDLAAVTVLDADEEDAFHGILTLGDGSKGGNSSRSGEPSRTSPVGRRAEPD